MKTQITIETTPNQELMIGLNLKGELVKANRAEVKAYFEGAVTVEKLGLENRANNLMKSAESYKDARSEA